MNQLFRLFVLTTLITSLNVANGHTNATDSLAVQQEIQSIRVKLVASRLAVERLSGKIRVIGLAQETAHKDIELALERLEESERLLNTTIELFKEQLDIQHQTIEEVKGMASGNKDPAVKYQLIGIVALAMFVVAMSIWYTRRVVKRQSANWNSFQEHLFKSRKI